MENNCLPRKMHKSERRLLTKIKFALEGKDKLLQKEILTIDDQMQMNKFDYVISLVIDKAPKEEGLFQDCFEALINHFPQACNNIPPLEELRKRIESTTSIQIKTETENKNEIQTKTEPVKCEIENVKESNKIEENLQQKDDENVKQLESKPNEEILKHLNQSQSRILIKLKTFLQIKDALMKKSNLSAEEEIQMKTSDFYIGLASERSSKETELFLNQFQAIIAQYPDAYRRQEIVSSKLPDQVKSNDAVELSSESINEMAAADNDDDLDLDPSVALFDIIANMEINESDCINRNGKKIKNSMNNQSESYLDGGMNKKASRNLQRLLRRFEITLEKKKQLDEKSNHTEEDENLLIKYNKLFVIILRRFSYVTNKHFLQKFQELKEKYKVQIIEAIERGVSGGVGGERKVEEEVEMEVEATKTTETVELNDNCVESEPKSDNIDQTQNVDASLIESSNPDENSDVSEVVDKTNKQLEINETNENEVNSPKEIPNQLIPDVSDSNSNPQSETCRLLTEFHFALKKRSELMEKESLTTDEDIEMKKQVEVIEHEISSIMMNKTDTHLKAFELIISQYPNAYQWYRDKWPQLFNNNSDQSSTGTTETSSAAAAATEIEAINSEEKCEDNSKNDENVEESEETNKNQTSDGNQEENDTNPPQYITREQGLSLNFWRYEFETKDKLMKSGNFSYDDRMQMEKVAKDVSQTLQQYEKDNDKNSLCYIELIKLLLATYSDTFKNESWFNQLNKKTQENKGEEEESNKDENVNVSDSDDSVIFIPKEIETVTIDDGDSDSFITNNKRVTRRGRNKRKGRGIRRLIEILKNKKRLMKKQQDGIKLTPEEERRINICDTQINSSLHTDPKSLTEEFCQALEELKVEYAEQFQSLPPQRSNKKKSTGNHNNFNNYNNYNNNCNRKRTHGIAFQNTAPPLLSWTFSNNHPPRIQISPRLQRQNLFLLNQQQHNRERGNQELTIAIIDQNDPLGIPDEKWKTIEAGMFHELIAYMEKNPGQRMPSFDDAGWSNNIKLIKCRDTFSLNWCKNILNRNNRFWPGSKLQAIPHEVEKNTKPPLAKITLPKAVDASIGFDLLKRQNTTIPTYDWRILKKKSEYHGDILILQINQMAEDILYPIHGKMSWGISNVYLYLKKRDLNDGNMNTFDQNEIERDMKGEGF